MKEWGLLFVLAYIVGGAFTLLLMIKIGKLMDNELDSDAGPIVFFLWPAVLALVLILAPISFIKWVVDKINDEL